ncbi:hypothetical protein WL29_28325 [Burkholderia ubonensis]|uniref:Uncharacterized protein n=1 Tax=Burkholderia ubonensis TaxID=101571 RepID=A0A125DLM3_9BURK|nr:hypothetical protein WL29_28325 [Burkholderia ubonensis]
MICLAHKMTDRSGWFVTSPTHHITFRINLPRFLLFVDFSHGEIELLILDVLVMHPPAHLPILVGEVEKMTAFMCDYICNVLHILPNYTLIWLSLLIHVHLAPGARVCTLGARKQVDCLVNLFPVTDWSIVDAQQKFHLENN